MPDLTAEPEVEIEDAPEFGHVVNPFLRRLLRRFARQDFTRKVHRPRRPRHPWHKPRDFTRVKAYRKCGVFIDEIGSYRSVRFEDVE